MSFNLSSSSSNSEDDDEYKSDNENNEKREFRDFFLNENRSVSVDLEDIDPNDDDDDNDNIDWEDGSIHDDNEESYLDNRKSVTELPSNDALKEVEVNLEEENPASNQSKTKRKRKRSVNIFKHVSQETSQLVLNIHRSHMLSLVANCVFHSGLAMEERLKHVCLSIIPEEYFNVKYGDQSSSYFPTIEQLKNVFEWFVELVHGLEIRRRQLANDDATSNRPSRKKSRYSRRNLKKITNDDQLYEDDTKPFISCSGSEPMDFDIVDKMLRFIEFLSPQNDYCQTLSAVEVNQLDLTTIFCCICRIMGWRARFVRSLQPLKKDLSIDHPLLSGDLNVLFDGMINEGSSIAKSDQASVPEKTENQISQTSKIVTSKPHDVVWVEILCLNSKSESAPPSWIHVDISWKVLNHPPVVETLHAIIADGGHPPKGVSLQSQKKRHKKGGVVTYVIAVEHQDSMDTCYEATSSYFNQSLSNITDVTPRYSSRWTNTLLSRGISKVEIMKHRGQCSDTWWSHTLKKANRKLRNKRKTNNASHNESSVIDVDEPKISPSKNSEHDIEAQEMDEFKKSHTNEPIPTAKASFKNHPFYAIKSMLNKDEVLRQNANKHICGMFKVRKELIRYPLKSPHLLFYFLKHQGEIVYRRSDIFKALSAKKWLYNRRKVLGSELNKPAKIRKVKSNNSTGKQSFKPLKSYGVGEVNDGSEQALEREIQKGLSNNIDRNDTEYLYGIWQTAEWSPQVVLPTEPIPVNEHNNIELELLNPGLFHLDERNMAKIAKRLSIPYAPCLIGFENSRQGRVPVIRGIVVHSHNADILNEAKFEMQSFDLEQENSKRMKTVYGRWKRLIVGLLTKERLEREYPDEKA